MFLVGLNFKDINKTIFQKSICLVILNWFLVHPHGLISVSDEGFL